LGLLTRPLLAVAAVGAVTMLDVANAHAAVAPTAGLPGGHAVAVVAVNSLPTTVLQAGALSSRGTAVRAGCTRGGWPGPAPCWCASGTV
jgi:hypothetical protein